MPLLTAHVKVVIEGTREGGEQWSTGFWLGTASAANQAWINAIADIVHTHFLTLWGVLLSRASSDTKPTVIKAYYYPANASTATWVAVRNAEYAVGTGTNNHPYQCAIVASLRTALPSRRGRGRMYLPLDSVGMGADGQYAAVQVSAIGAAVADFIDAVNAAMPVGTYVVVASQASGVSNRVNSVITDSVPDIQRRRANRLAPATRDVQPIA